MPRTPAQNEAIRQTRRAQIMDAARQVFAKRGFHAARMSDIASAAGVSQGTLYHYFRSKDQLFLALLNVWNDRIGEMLSNLSAPSAGAPDKFWLVNQVAQSFFEADEALAPVLIEFWAYALRNKEAASSFRQLFLTMQQTFSDILNEGIAAGDFEPIDVETLSALPLIVLDGVILLSTIVGRDLLNPSEAIKEAQQVIFSGLLTNEAGEAE